MKNTLRGIAIFAILVTILVSCKKEDLIPINLFQKQSNVNQKQTDVNNFKNWYESEKLTISAKIRTNQEKGVDLIFEPLWNNSNVQQIGEYIVFSTAVNTALRNLDDGKTKFNLVIRYDGKTYEGKIVSVRNLAYKNKFSLNTKDLYDLAFTQNEIINPEINAHIKVLSTNFRQDKEELIQNNKRRVIPKDSKNIQKSSAGNYVVCFDYYIDLYHYDQAGDLINVTTSYWKTECEVRETQAIWWIDNGDGTYGGGSINQSEDSRDTEEMREFEIDLKSRMSQAEKQIYDLLDRRDQLHYLSNAITATAVSIARYPFDSYQESKQDAFRHAYFNLLNANNLGSAIAELLGTARETKVNGVYSLQSLMDLHNNAEGRGAWQPVLANVLIYYATLIDSLMANGSLRYIKNGVLTPTNQ